MVPLNTDFIDLFSDRAKLLYLIKPMLSKKISCFAPLEHHLFDRIWVLKTYEELKIIYNGIKETKISPNSKFFDDIRWEYDK